MSERHAIVFLRLHVHAHLQAHLLPDGRLGYPKLHVVHAHFHMCPASQFGNGLGQCVFHVGCADVFE